ncbi:hypothetical protein CEUSTIGMA_g2655.t1 [Chlamydomonas eustigma]|uniref:Uncharacterized protein n=1 Tax=Chlamydomonas eustigma TaxID=1157962 RepID=A0A250WWL9_9CHLO|nr:hypothetical protein CEUSTIGMA_g2655.t1 [Chlamydomonas eustigma]|eukprot:GAX75211.1 hypothetical protein CEUSTIGMA_g2655.t1 [Chlamydomonas eustigma]
MSRLRLDADGVSQHLQRVKSWTIERADKLNSMTFQLRQTDLSNTPDWIRRAIRLSVCFVLFGLLAHAIDYPDNYGLAKELHTTFSWAAITCTVVTAPLIGKVSEVSTYRIIGTVVGGLWGFFMFSIGVFTFTSVPDGDGPGVFVSLLSPLVAVATTFLAYKLGLDQLARFTQLTYILVGYGTYNNAQGAFLQAVVRIGGIISGALVSLMLSVIILPRSATVEACREAKKALKLLIDLNDLVWSSHHFPASSDVASPSTSPISSNALAQKRKRKQGSLTSFNSASNLFSSSANQLSSAGRHDEATDLKYAITTPEREEAERIYTSVYMTLMKVEEMMDQCKGEVYVHHLKGHYFFLPGLHFFQAGRWHLPYEDMRMLVAAVRRIVRLQWTLLLSFEQGFDENMSKVLQHYYPKALMSELSYYMHHTLMDLHISFPNASNINIDNFLSLGQMVECLVQISNTWNRQNSAASNPLLSHHHDPNAKPYGHLDQHCEDKTGKVLVFEQSPFAPGSNVGGQDAVVQLRAMPPTYNSSFPTNTAAATASCIINMEQQPLLPSVQKDSLLPVSAISPSGSYQVQASARISDSSILISDGVVPPVQHPYPHSPSPVDTSNFLGTNRTLTTFPHTAAVAAAGTNINTAGAHHHSNRVVEPAIHSAVSSTLFTTHTADERSRNAEIVINETTGLLQAVDGMPLTVSLPDVTAPNISHSSAFSIQHYSANNPVAGALMPASSGLFTDLINKARRSMSRAGSIDLPTDQLLARGSSFSASIGGSGAPRSARISSVNGAVVMAVNPTVTSTASGGLPTSNRHSHDATVLTQGGAVPMSHHLSSVAAAVTVVVPPICFPPTEEGYISQVHWYSFQLAMDQLVEELEQAFLAVSAVLEKLPHPIC